MKVWSVRIDDDSEIINVIAETYAEAGKKALKWARLEVSETADIIQITLLAECI